MDDLEGLTKRINELTILVQLRVPSDAGSKAMPSQNLLSEINHSMDDIERRIKEARETISREKKLLEMHQEPLLKELRDAKVSMERMLVNIPRHLPKIRMTSTAKPAEDHSTEKENDMPITANDRKPLQQSSQGNLPANSTAPSLSSLPVLDEQPVIIEAKKMSLSVSPITIAEFEDIPKYLINRLTRDKLNDLLSELNKMIQEKYTTLKIPQPKMTKPQRERFWEHKKLITEETKGKAFITEKEVIKNWAKANFKLDPAGRGLIAALRHLGRIKEVRGGGQTRIVVL
ncbi:Spindle and kinetochore-associated protein 1 [Phlyctochytrium planicorne]|nr:Spindle and kinetochore-associated protein 1 [Phlyctochytrium planicorne]